MLYTEEGYIQKLERIQAAHDRLLWILCLIALRILRGEKQHDFELPGLENSIVDWRYSVSGGSKQTEEDYAHFGIKRD